MVGGWEEFEVEAGEALLRLVKMDATPRLEHTKARQRNRALT
jgi:hypothetical protein